MENDERWNDAVIYKEKHHSVTRENLLSKVTFCSLFHFRQHHAGNLFRQKLFCFAFVLHDNNWLVVPFTNDLERPMFHIGLDGWLTETAADKTFCVKHCVVGVHGDLAIAICSKREGPTESLRSRRDNGEKNSRKNCIWGAQKKISNLILCSITDQPFSVREGDIRRGGTVSLVVCNNFNPEQKRADGIGPQTGQPDVTSGSLGLNPLILGFRFGQMQPIGSFFLKKTLWGEEIHSCLMLEPARGAV